VKEATTLTGASSKREWVDLALRELIRSRRKKNLFDLADKIQLTDDYDHKGLRELTPLLYYLGKFTTLNILSSHKPKFNFCFLAARLRPKPGCEKNFHFYRKQTLNLDAES
jgi:hypothetical protein